MDRPIVYSKSYASDDERAAYGRLSQMLKECPIPPTEILANLSLFLGRPALGDLLFMHDLYRRIVNVHGVVIEFGTRWGRNLALFHTLRTLYEPYNIFRRIVAFDTFEGFPSVAPQDGKAEAVAEGVLSVTAGYEDFLEELLSAHEQLAPRAHHRKFELVKGDATQTLPKYLEEHPETIIALAYFDMDLYEPTKRCLELIKPHLTKGSVVGFDELTINEYPGETVAFREVLGTGSYRLQRSPLATHQSFIVIE